MGSVPLHPALVHLPLGLAMLTPLIGAIVFISLRKQWVPKKAWGLVLLLQGMLVASAFIAMRAGSSEEDRVEAIVSEQAIETHEERAELFTWAAVAGLALALSTMLAFGRAPRAATGLAGATVAATVLVAGLGVWTGHAGGKLVYQHGAAAAYSSAAAGGQTTEAGAGGDDHEERERRRRG